MSLQDVSVLYVQESNIYVTDHFNSKLLEHDVITIIQFPMCYIQSLKEKANEQMKGNRA